MNKNTVTRRVLATAGVCLTGAVLTACQSTTSEPAAAGTTPVTVAATTTPAAVAATTMSAPMSTTPPPAAAPTTPVAVIATPIATEAAVPTLGTSAWAPPDEKGYGLVKPATIFNGGDPSGLVTGVTWSDWGSSKAVGSGTAEYIAPGQSDADGTQAAATVAAFDLGTCDSKLMYQEIEWYFPEHGQSFNANSYINICTGAYHNM
jgi:hypothetical protein